MTIETAQEIVTDFVSKAKEGDKLVVEVYRKDKKGNMKLKTLKGKVKKVKVTEENVIDIIKDPTDKQVTARRAWLGID
jgi:carbonic anhydrase